jgi:hypothetical protein
VAITASLIKAAVENLAAAVQLRGAVLSMVVPRAVDPVKLEVKAGREETVKAVIRLKKSIMVSLLLWPETLKVPEMALNEALQKDENPSIRALENPVIRAKASDF